MHKKIEDLIFCFKQLPGIGERSARRIILDLLKLKGNKIPYFISALQAVENEIQECSLCYNLDLQDPCIICNDSSRNSQLCIVEDLVDLWAMERTGSYKGLYFVWGSLSTENYSKVRQDKLIKMIKDSSSIKEVIIALNPTLDGQTMRYYIHNIIKDLPVKISSLSSGIPLGGELDYLDQGTISMALKMRRSID